MYTMSSRKEFQIPLADMAKLSIGVSDMQVNADEDEILGAIEEREVVSAARPIGFRNLGNTCYQNAVLQLIMSSKLVIAAEQRDDNRDHVAASLRALVDKIEMARAGSCASVTAEEVREAMGQMDARWVNGRQQDAAEFLDAVLQAAGSTSPSGAVSRDPVGEVEVTKTCMRCGRSTVLCEPATCLSVTLPRTGTATMETMLDALYGEETAENLPCPCAPGRSVRHGVRRQIKQLPEVMAVVVNRVDTSEDGSGHVKMTTPLCVAEELDMGKYGGVPTHTCGPQDNEVVVQAPTTPERTAGTAVRTYASDDDDEEEEREVLEVLEALGIFDPMDIDVLPWSECESQEELSVDMEDAESSDADEVTSSGSCSIGSFSSPSSSSSSSSSSSVSTPSSSSSAYYSSSSSQQYQRFCAWGPGSPSRPKSVKRRADCLGEGEEEEAVQMLKRCRLEAESWAASVTWVVAAAAAETADTDAMDVEEVAPEVEAEQELEAMEVEGGGVDASYDGLLAGVEPCMAALSLGLKAASVTAASEPEAVAEPAGISVAAAVDGDDDGGDDPGLAEAIQRSMMQPPHGHAALDNHHDGRGPSGNTSVTAVRYRLEGVVCHQGLVPTSGHYTADVRGAARGQVWHHCDDEAVSPMELAGVLQHAGAEGRIFFYRFTPERCVPASQDAPSRSSESAGSSSSTSLRSSGHGGSSSSSGGSSGNSSPRPHGFSLCPLWPAQVLMLPTSSSSRA